MSVDRPASDLRHPLVLLIVFAVVWSILAVAPVARDVWLIENILVVGFVVLLFTTARTYRFSNASYNAVFAFLFLHAIGAHFTYGQVPLPLDFLDADRNAYDRFVHLAFGALFVVPFMELHRDVVRAPRAWPRVLAVETILAASALYELAEWLFTEIAPASAGAGFLATQGDAFDAFKDVGLAGLGAALTMTFSAAAAPLVTKPQRPSVPAPKDVERPSRR